MKKIIAAAGLGAAVTIGSLVGAGTASANATDDFLSRVHSEGISSSERGDASLIYNGNLVCRWLDSGTTVVGVLENVYYGTALNSSESGAFVGIAVSEFCPEHIPAILAADAAYIG